MGYESINPGSLNPQGTPFTDALMAAREQSRKEDADRWAQVRDQGEGDRAQQRINLESTAQNDRLSMQHQDYIAQHTQKAMELDAAGMPLQAEAYAKLHNIPWIGSHRQAAMKADAQAGPQPTPQPQGQPAQEAQPAQPSAPSQQPSQPQGGREAIGPHDGTGVARDADGNLRHESPEETAHFQRQAELLSPRPSMPGNYQGGGLAGFDVGAASRNLAGVGQPQPDQSPQWTPIQGQQQEAPPAPQAQAVPQQSAPMASMQRVDRSVQGSRQTVMTPLGPVEVDPMETENAHNAANSRRAELYKGIMGKIPSMAGSAPEYAGLLAADEGIKGSDVLGMQKAEIAAKAKAQEDADKKTEELRSKADVATQSRWQHERNLAIMAGKGGGPGQPDPHVLGGWENHKNHAKTDTMFKQVTQNKASLDEIDAQLNDPDPVSQAMALHRATALSTSMGTSGGRVTVQAARDLKDAFGLVTSYENKAYRALHSGMNMPSVTQKYQQAMANLRLVVESQAAKAYENYTRTAGLGSHWVGAPSMAGFVADEDAATKAELGLPPEYGDNGEASTPVAPAHRAATHRGGSGMPSGAVTGTLNGKRVWATPDGRHGDL